MAESIFMGDVRPAGKTDPFVATAPSQNIQRREFERTRQAMLVEFRRLLEHGAFADLSDAVGVAGDTQRTMLQLATLLCDFAS